MDKLNLENYKIELQNEESDKIYNDLVEKSIELAREIADMKNIDLVRHDNIEDTLSNIQIRFEKKSASFRGIIYLMNDLITWNCDDIDDEIDIEFEDIFDDYEEIDLDKEMEIDENLDVDAQMEVKERKENVELLEYKDLLLSLEQKVKDCIYKYNGIIYELEQYKKLEKEISEKGYDKLIKEREERLINLFKEMLDYKNKKYDEDISFRDLLDKISQYYNGYNVYLDDLYAAINMGSVSFDIEEDSIPINEVESLMIIDDFCDVAIDEDWGYKTEADRFRDFELEEGETFKDLYDKEIEKFKNLFKEMLEHRNIEYTDEDKFDDLKWKVMEAYPYYYVMLYHLISPNPNVTYIQELNSMEDVYEAIVSEYKNHEENLIKYKDYMDLIRKEGYDIDNKKGI